MRTSSTPGFIVLGIGIVLMGIGYEPQGMFFLCIALAYGAGRAGL